jgi:hypothetical protein
MKLMGVLSLRNLSQGEHDELGGSVSALVAELQACAWRSMAEITGLFPSAVIDGIKARILIDGGYHVDLRVDCEAQMILIEHAGAERGDRVGKRGSNAA